MKDNRIKRFNENSELNISDVMFSFSDMIGFIRWILQGDDMGNITRYITLKFNTNLNRVLHIYLVNKR